MSVFKFEAKEVADILRLLLVGCVPGIVPLVLLTFAFAAITTS